MFAYYLGATGIEYVCILLLEITKNATDMKKKRCRKPCTGQLREKH